MKHILCMWLVTWFLYFSPYALRIVVETALDVSYWKLKLNNLHQIKFKVYNYLIWVPLSCASSLSMLMHLLHVSGTFREEGSTRSEIAVHA